jgi:hypothetical protein
MKRLATALLWIAVGGGLVALAQTPEAASALERLRLTSICPPCSCEDTP